MYRTLEADDVPKPEAAKMKDKQPAALIVGGGIGGMTTALALHRIGWQVHVFEQAPVLGEVGAGISLWPNATRVLQRLGVLDALIEAGQPIERVQICKPSGQVLSEVTAGAAFEVPSLCIHRAALHRILVEALPPSMLHLGEGIDTFQETDTRVTVDYRGKTFRGNVLIGSDGIHSCIRQQIVGSRQPMYRGYTVWRGIAPCPVPDAYTHMGTETWGSGRRFGLFPVGPKQAYWYATANEHAPSSSDAPEASKTKVIRLFGDWHAPIRSILEATPDTAILKHPTLDRPPISRWYEGRAVLLGDAAHPMTPNLGQGACQAIEDAAALAQALHQHSDVPTALAAYNQRRTKRTKPIVQQSLWMGAIGQWKSPLATGLRDFVLWATPSKLSNLTQKALFRYDGSH